MQTRAVSGREYLVWLALIISALCLFAGCRTTSGTEVVREERTLDVDTTESKRSVVEFTGGATDWRLETWEFGPVVEAPDAGSATDSDAGSSSQAQDTGLITPHRRFKSGPRNQPLLRHSIATAHVEPIVAKAVNEEASRTQAKEKTKAAAEVKRDSRPAWSPPAWAWVVVPVALLIVVLGAVQLRRSLSL